MDIRLFKPSVGNDELESIKQVFSKAWLGLGPRVGEFEKKWSDYIGTAESVGVNSCTAALHLALSAFKFPQGKKVLVPVVTFAATAMAVLYNGLVPVFVDVDETTFGISMEDLERKYDSDCVAVIPVHFMGHPVPMDQLMPWARARGLKVIEDTAHSAGGKYLGKALGTWGDIGCFSFEEKKCMTTGDGGMISSNDPELLRPLRHSRWVGINKDTWERYEENASYHADANSWYYEISDVGYKYNMNDLMASIGLVQLAKLDTMNRRREEIIRQYVVGLAGSNLVQPAIPYNLNDSSYWAFVVRVKEREQFILHMKKNGVATGVHYMPLTMHPLFVPYKAETPVADTLWRELVTLPLFPDLTDEEVAYVLESVQSYAP
ncbi:aminotransferase class I/II-fold pyridoxal phosphate-dependent enzyme [Paenibacillus sp. 5J-6]|uniref:Aminotransferase class I/II-fold pyridoxal phosphate-dependent enzyme n=1 Tax=Paenibacillus silvestris TaxID=2606219 RepID=A0A6L8V0X9_9BACL|nr:DegT/DnrJ/EryC1/StrS family aminotransferase [Paenibacillus silvestris]MZQ84128.1 aminotransferase class I/II-fold pyridoxal phosphate-dependent enzyme [Paenibacillus silvestris]